MKVKSASIVMMLVIMSISGCATTAQHHQSYVDTHSELEHHTQKATLNDKIFLYMTREQVRVSLGRPYEINRSVSSVGEREQWIYKAYNPKGYPTCSFVPTHYLYFENGKLTGWQEK